MSRRLFIFDPPDVFLPATVGEPGQRTFFLHARKGRAVVNVALEKAQVSALADRMTDLLVAVDELQPSDSTTLDAEPAAAAAAPGGPMVEAFRVGAMALSWDGEAERVVIEAQPEDASGEYVEAEDSDEDGPDLMRVRIGIGEAQAFVRRAQALVTAGRPPCPFCGQPLEATGHFCLRSNGQLN